MSKKILLVDDDVEDREIIQDALGDLGYDSVIHFEENGEKALAFLESAFNSGSLPSMVILDLNMPRMNGTQTLRQLKKDTRFRNIPVIIYSTSLNRIERDECLSLGAHSYVIKPVSYRDTVATAKRFYEMSMGMENPR
ncbi:MAG: response regulator [Chitinophagaceae bacterium]|nr:response regulator [Chitinophagaceae bacterium]